MITFGSEFLGGVAKDAIDGKNITVSEIGTNIGNATINTVTTLLSGKLGEALGKLAPKLKQKFAPYLRNLISHDEIFQDGIADWLFEYAGSGAADAKEALKMLAQYTGAESLYDVAVNRMNSFGDSLLEEGINRINLLENSEFGGTGAQYGSYRSTTVTSIMFDGNQVLESSGTVKQCFYDSYKNMLSSNFKIGAFKTGVATAGITDKNVLTNQNEDECKQQKKGNK